MEKDQDEFEDTRGVILICKLKKYRQYNGQQKKDQRTNYNLQNTKQKTNDRATRIPLKTGNELSWSGRVGSYYYNSTKKTKGMSKTPSND